MTVCLLRFSNHLLCFLVVFYVTSIHLQLTHTQLGFVDALARTNSAFHSQLTHTQFCCYFCLSELHISTTLHS